MRFKRKKGNRYKVIWPAKSLETILWLPPVGSSRKQVDFSKEDWEHLVREDYDVVMIWWPWGLCEGRYLNREASLTNVLLNRLQEKGITYLLTLQLRVAQAKRWLELQGYFVKELHGWIHLEMVGVYAQKGALPEIQSRHVQRKENEIVCKVIKDAEDPYRMAELMCPDGKFLELFGHPKSGKSGWLTLYC